MLDRWCFIEVTQEDNFVCYAYNNMETTNPKNVNACLLVHQLSEQYIAEILQKFLLHYRFY